MMTTSSPEITEQEINDLTDEEIEVEARLEAAAHLGYLWPEIEADDRAYPAYLGLE